MKTVDDIIRQLQNINNLPTLPIVIEKLRQAIHNPNSDAQKIATIIEDDPAIMARILKVVNSAFYASNQQITSVQHAVARIGMSALNNIALSTAVFSSFRGESSPLFDKNEFWRHSISTGIAATVVYNRASKNIKHRFSKDLLHLAGLLHDIGKVILAQYFNDEFMIALQASKDSNIPLFEAERQTIGANHCVIGTWLADRWRLDPSIQQTIQFHHQPDQAEEQHKELVQLIHIANHICNEEKIGCSGDSAPILMHTLWKSFGLTVSDIPEIVDQVTEESAKSEILLALV